ncbi:BolA family transcriptional regulator [Tianweitania sp. BSSL-BM11]|uniref:BolA family transcriptional regulator n=1 Tax=Tianweitania aestuarii TaxID=2814886 RepID=A0ABS5RZ68_9HYPH|nr:BolA family protein [Tianweitania aestuarii]MBS9722343.1 BolA family transcriptional regulator [Tianweitania aestuarii]
MSIQEKIESKLTQALQPERLAVINESHLHAGHQPSFNGSGETHFRVRVVSAKFDGLSRIERHRMVNELLENELAVDKVHALAIEPAAPGEATRW